MAALLVLEGMVRPEYLKPHWRPFSQPAPQPADICEWRQAAGPPEAALRRAAAGNCSDLYLLPGLAR